MNKSYLYFQKIDFFNFFFLFSFERLFNTLSHRTSIANLFLSLWVVGKDKGLPILKKVPVTSSEGEVMCSREETHSSKPKFKLCQASVV